MVRWVMVDFTKVRRILKLEEAEEVLEGHAGVPDGLISDVRARRVFLAEDEDGEIVVVMRTDTALDALERYGVIGGNGN